LNNFATRLLHLLQLLPERQPNSSVFKTSQRAPEMSVQQYLMSISTTWDRHISEGPMMSKLPIGGPHPCFIVAEIGQNHQGDINIAKDLIRHAKESGANCVKFQKSSLKDRFTRSALDAPYDSVNSFGKTYGEHRARLEFSEDEFRELQRYAEEVVKIMFTASPMDIPSVDLLVGMKVPFIKIGSGDTNNYGLIEHIAQTSIPVILSTGMSELRTVKHAYDIIAKYHNNVALLHCISSYPTMPKDVNLRVIDLFRSEFPESPIGYSSHEKGYHICIAAVARGAKIIEKHITKDHKMKGTDHACSLEPSELTAMVKSIREVELSLGEPKKKILPSEEACLNKLGKSICTTRKIPAGAVIRPTDVVVKVSRPMGIRPQEMPYIVGATMANTVEGDTPLTANDVIL
jgi:sialic acid synthase